MNTINDILTQVRNAADDKDSPIAIALWELVALLWADGKSWRGSAGRGPLEQTFSSKNIRSRFFVPTPITGFNNERHIEPFLENVWAALQRGSQRELFGAGQRRGATSHHCLSFNRGLRCWKAN